MRGWCATIAIRTAPASGLNAQQWRAHTLPRMSNDERTVSRVGGDPAHLAFSMRYLLVSILLILAPFSETSPMSPFSPKTNASTGLLSVWVS